MPTRFCKCGKEFIVKWTDKGPVYKDGVQYKVCPQCGQSNYVKELLLFNCNNKEYQARSREAHRIGAITVYIDDFRDLELYGFVEEECKAREIEFPDLVQILRKRDDDWEVIEGYDVYHTSSACSDYPILEYEENEEEIENLFTIAEPKSCLFASVWIEWKE